MRKLIPFIGILLGLAIIGFYPASELYESYQRAALVEQMEQIQDEVVEDTSAYDEMMAQARSYNAVLAQEGPEVEDIIPYEDQLNPSGHRTPFASIHIPSLNLTMPIYHGTSDAVLSAGVGHLDDSALPIGGPSTHTVLTAHSGMTRTRAFDDISELIEGDTFTIKTFDHIVAYRVTSSEVVLPHEVESLEIKDGEDLATLVTCTPYGINSHRLLVHAEATGVDQVEEPPPYIQTFVRNRRTTPFLIAFVFALSVGFVMSVLNLKHIGRRIERISA